MAYIYIMTNPALRDMVKIGFATDVEQRSTIKAGGAASQRNDILAKAAQMLHELELEKIHSLVDGAGCPAGAFRSEKTFGFSKIADGVYVRANSGASAKTTF